jgi:hypothetical protein
MGGRGRIKGGFTRMLGRHDGWEGRAFGRARDDLMAAFTLDTGVLRFEASRVAMLRVQLEAANRALVEAQRKRRKGKGRRPNARRIEQLSRRLGLADGSYAQAFERLKEMAEAQKRPPSPADVVRQLRGGLG